ncbi:vacuolar import and degradation protein, putative [Candida dubliniensis CD36]|uniref:Vacuolar import and degradation protein, putative n=1 Tax=Candida dubliniensis (strain CD36 / ATCC MYA-646 / CBS 7987 / NCPF 3949 / NRRL Y-17841) TaxID=573826 RepID=B9WIA2_CANDC|nr:vacuolar import and degradation protein, putative [Candida dubliniensis CD36]CAX40964.1 vacuolar import and degradation protein, putative [Candida dubliniensis CD36]
MNFIKKFIGTTTTDEVASIPSGKLYLTRSKQSPKGAIECLYNDAFASIKRTTSPHYYQLCITKVYQEGESDFNRFDDSEEEYDGDDLAPASDTRRQSKDEWIFPIADELKIHVCEKEDGSRAIAWKDLNGDLGDKFEFVIDEEVRGSEVDAFRMTIYKCLFENKYQTEYSKANDLNEFIYNPKGELLTFDELKDLNDLEEFDDETDEYEDCDETLPANKDAPKGETKYVNTDVDLHLYDTRTGTFIFQLSKPEVKLVDLGNWEYTLYVHGESTRINTTLSKNMNPTFNYQHLSFIFNDYTVDEDGINAHSWLLKFPDYNDLSKFQTVFLGLMYEALNKRKWGETEQDYFVDAFSKISINKDAKELESEEEEEEEESEDENQGDGPVKWESKQNEKNSNLTVGYAKDRSYVVRGDKIGVFSEDDAGQLNFQTAITNVADLKGNHFTPEKMLLHQQDQYMIISNPQFDDKALYKMDLTRGKIVEEWEVSKDLPVKSYAPTSKFAQLTDEQTLTGISANGLFTIDPRLSGTKLVNDKTYKAYKTSNNQFQTLATTDKGYIALGSGKGDIRLFDRLGVNAKTALPSLGDPIIGIDVSKDGRWLLATCETYLLLIDNKIGDGQKNAGKLGFTNYFDKDKKPTPRRLALKPEHEAYMVRENGGKPLAFTPAYFNTGRDSKETTIVTSLGKYIVTWSMGKVLLDKPNPYLVKRYTQNVIADNFKFGSNNEVIMALQDDVSMVSRRSLANPKNVFN